MVVHIRYGAALASGRSEGGDNSVISVIHCVRHIDRSC
jgi:hypothetical protein